MEFVTIRPISSLFQPRVVNVLVSLIIMLMSSNGQINVVCECCTSHKRLLQTDTMAERNFMDALVKYNSDEGATRAIDFVQEKVNHQLANLSHYCQLRFDYVVILFVLYLYLVLCIIITMTIIIVLCLRFV